MILVFKAGLQYFALVFAAGLLLGTARTLLLQPMVGSTVAVLLELPLMLAIAWVACALVIRRTRVPARMIDRALMGFTALVLLLLAEAALSIFFGRALSEHFLLYRRADAQLGLMAQIAFAAFPFIRRRAGALE